MTKYCKDYHLFKLITVSESGKKYWICEKCGYKTDWNPNQPDYVEPRTVKGSLD